MVGDINAHLAICNCNDLDSEKILVSDMSFHELFGVVVASWEDIMVEPEVWGALVVTSWLQDPEEVSLLESGGEQTPVDFIYPTAQYL